MLKDNKVTGRCARGLMLAVLFAGASLDVAADGERRTPDFRFSDAKGAPELKAADQGGALEPVTERNNRPAPDNHVTDGKALTLADCTFPRSDDVEEIEVAEGYWGDWATCVSYCPQDTFVYAIQLQSEPSQGTGVRRGDDTALNAIALGCYHRTTGEYRGYVTSSTGPWGNILDAVGCENVLSPVIAAELLVEGKQGSGNNDDDTAANDARVFCDNGTQLDPPAYTSWGTWRGRVSCPVGTAVCGMKTRVEGNRGGGASDDTALNGLRLTCCTF